MINITSKLPQLGTSIFSAMSALAQSNDAINLSQGFPDFNCDPNLIALVNEEMKAGHNQYAPMPGCMPLREVISEKIFSLYKSEYHPDTEITITAGGTQAIFTSIASIIRPNDDVIVFEPAYDSYAPVIKLFGGLVKSYEMSPPDYSIDWNMVKKLVSSSTKMIIINTPHNPTGTILKENDIKELIKITKNTDIVIVSDEVYEHIIFDNHNHRSLASYPELRERTFLIYSFGKLFHNTGWKVGYCCAPEPLMKEFRKIHQFEVFSVNTPLQLAFAKYLKDKNVYLNLSDFYQQKRDKFCDLMRGTRFTLLKCEGTYFQTVTYERITEEHDLEFAKRLIIENKVASIPHSAFYSKHTNFNTLRFCFAKEQETLEKAVENLIKL